MFKTVCDFLNDPVRLLLALCLMPVLGGGLAWLARGKHQNALRMLVVLLFGAADFLAALALFLGGGASGVLAFGTEGLALTFAVSGLSSLMLLFASFMFLAVAVYAASWFRKKEGSGLYLLLLFVSLGMVNGALMSDNLGILLFFWEGLLCTLFGILLIGRRDNPKTAIKALALSGTADLIMMLGIVTTAHVAGTLNMSGISHLPIRGLGALGCACMLLGAMGKAGAMPFHSWIPDAATDAPAPFLAAFPGSLEKIAGIYLMARIVGDLYAVRPGSGMSLFAMIIGAATLFFGVAMALIQKDMKRLLSYHAISQVGYMILGIGTGLAVGIMGGVFHMMNHVLYKSGLFITAGAVEDQTGTTDLHKIGGLGRVMPATAACFIVCALSIAGFPGFNGFFSKELIFDAALESGAAFYVVALLGAFMTAASFLKLGGAAFFGKVRLPQNHRGAKEAPAGILVPALVLSAMCVFFGAYNAFPLDRLIGPALGSHEAFGGWPHSTALVLISCAALVLALVDHLYGRKRDGGALQAADHIHYAPGVRQCYALAERGKLDPYFFLMAAANGFSAACVWVEKGVSYLYDKAIPALVTGAGRALRAFWNGSVSRYLVIAAVGVACILAIFLAVLL
ncbi:MAG TPA: proton-conducting transporter membrane subunit [Clostridia bacterium]|nr:proton-conducting transporter membrane subunit [Clostridia bacterium]